MRINRYIIIRHSDDTGAEVVAHETHRADVARRMAADLNRAARYYGAAVTYRVAEPITQTRRRARGVK